ncbi:MAG: response regulator transcription factor [bacterium]|nr:response regulator transcription factor [bacterium]
MPESSKVRLLVADDHPFLLEGIQALLAPMAETTVVGHALSGEEAVHLASQLQPDIILMDVSMDGINGIEATRQILMAQPEAVVIILTMHDGAEYVRQATHAGARGYVLKSAAPGLILHAIRTVAGGEVFYDPAITHHLGQDSRDSADASSGAPLTPREQQVLGLLAQGLLNKEIADKLCLSVRTVETYRERLMRKLSLHSVAELTRYAIAEKIVLLQ